MELFVKMKNTIANVAKNIEVEMTQLQSNAKFAYGTSVLLHYSRSRGGGEGDTPLRGKNIVF